MTNHICPNCGQWQYRTQEGFRDCTHECAKRGFAPKIPVPTALDETYERMRTSPEGWGGIANFHSPDQLEIMADRAEELGEDSTAESLRKLAEIRRRNNKSLRMKWRKSFGGGAHNITALIQEAKTHMDEHTDLVLCDALEEMGDPLGAEWRKLVEVEYHNPNERNWNEYYRVWKEIEIKYL